MGIAFLHSTKSRSAVQRASQNLQNVNFLKYSKELEYEHFTTYVVEPILSDCVKIETQNFTKYRGIRRFI